MAFHNTSERYRYIYGNNVTRMDYREEMAPARRIIPDQSAVVTHTTKQSNPEKEAMIRKNKEKLLAFDWKFTVVTLLAVLMCALGCLAYVHGTVELNHLSAQVAEMKSEKAELLSKQTALQTEIDKSINMDEIRKYAKEKLHMIYPDAEHILYYHDSTSDYFRQFESINAGK